MVPVINDTHQSLLWNSSASNLSYFVYTLAGVSTRQETTSLHLVDVTVNMTNFDSNVTMPSPSMCTAIQVADVLEFKVTPVICSLGIVLNILNLLVLTERGLKESPYVYLRALSLTDLSALVMTSIFLLFTSPPGPQVRIASDGSAAGDFGVLYGAYFFLPLNSICNNTSTWLVVTLTIERFLFVRRPLWARDMCTPKSAKMKTLIVLVAITLLNVPRFMSYRVAPSLPTDHDHGGVLQIEPTQFRYSEANKKILWIYSVLFGAVPLLVLCFCNSYLIYAVKKAKRQRVRLKIRNNMEPHWNREQTRLTLTLISIVCLAIICILPAAFGDGLVTSYIFSKSDRLRQFLQSPFYKVFRSLSNLLLICNMSLNFVLYSAFNDKFVKVLKKMIRRWKHRLTCKPTEQRSAFVRARVHRTVVKTPSTGSKEGRTLTKSSNIDQTQQRQCYRDDHHHHQQQQREQQQKLVKCKVHQRQYHRKNS